MQVDSVRVNRQAAVEEVVIELDKAAKHRVFTLKNPHRLVMDLPSFEWEVNAAQLARTRSRLITQIRYARFDASTSRVVFDLNQPVRYEVDSPEISQTKRLRLVPKGKEVTQKSPPAWERKKRSRPPVVTPGKAILPTSKAQDRKKPLIVIDAGHGGKDSGAIGKRSKTREKIITLRYARALRDALKKNGKFQVALTRNEDKIIPLRERFRIARRKKADLFLSIHADAAPNPDARGLSVYTLSEKASDAEAAALAQQENKVDLLADVDLTHENEEVAGILIDLARRDTKNKSVTLAEQVVKAMKGKVNLLKNPHRHAGFAVLKAPDIPSILVEVGFLSHRQEEKLLNQKEHQTKVVNGLAKAIENYFKK